MIRKLCQTWQIVVHFDCNTTGPSAIELLIVVLKSVLFMGKGTRKHPRQLYGYIKYRFNLTYGPQIY